VLIDTSQTRDIDRRDEPSTIIERMRTRVSRGSRFMSVNMGVNVYFVKHFAQFDSQSFYTQNP